MSKEKAATEEIPSIASCGGGRGEKRGLPAPNTGDAQSNKKGERKTTQRKTTAPDGTKDPAEEAKKKRKRERMARF